MFNEIEQLNTAGPSLHLAPLSAGLGLPTLLVRVGGPLTHPGIIPYSDLGVKQPLCLFDIGWACVV